jgi:hypothetical protein
MAKPTEPNLRTFVHIVLGMVCLLYLLACFLPCIDCGPDIQSGDPGFPDVEKGPHLGVALLLLGWAGGNNGVPWTANLFLALSIACLCIRRLRVAVVFSAIASLLGLTTWWARRYDAPLVGYYEWQASLFVLAGGAVLALRKSKRLEKRDRVNSERGDSAPAATLP